MKLTLLASLALCATAAPSAALSADDTGVPIVRVSLDVARPFVLAGRSVKVNATPYNAVDAPLDGRSLQWTVSDPQIAAIDDTGNLRGLRPGVVDVAASDSDSGVAGHLNVFVYPARMIVTVDPATLEVGDTGAISTQVLDADGNPLAGVGVTFSLGDSGLAAIVGSTITATAEGRTALTASISMGPDFNAYTTSTVIEVFRRGDFIVKRLILTDTTVASNISLGVPAHATAFGNYVAAITSLSNGGQGLVLARLGQKPRIIDSAGSIVNGKVIASFYNVAVNANGDVAAAAYTPSEWCEEMILVYHASDNWKPNVVLDTTSCSADIQPRALDRKGGLVYRFGSDYVHWNADGSRSKLFGYGDTVAGLKPLSYINGWGYTPLGTLVFLWGDTSGLLSAATWDGVTFNKIVSSGGIVNGQTLNYIELPAEINPGDFIARVFLSNGSAIARWKGSASSTVIMGGANGLGGIDSYFDGMGEDIYFHGESNGAPVLMHINGTNLTTVTKFVLGREIGPIFVATPDTVISYSSTGAAPLTVQQFKGTTATLVMGPAVAADGSAYLGLTQNSFSRGASSAGPIFRTAGDFIVKWTGSGFTTILKPGDPVPGGHSLGYIQSFAANRKGDFVITAVTQQNRSGIWAYRNGSLQLLAESDQKIGPGNATYQSAICCDRPGSYLAINASGQVATVASTSLNAFVYFFDSGSTALKYVAQLNAGAPGGGTYNCCPTVQLTDSGHIAFGVYISGKGNTLFYWDGGTSVRRIIGQGDMDPNGRTFYSVYNLTASADRFFFTGSAAFGNQLYGLDASGALSVVFQPNSTTTTGLLVNSLFGPDLSADASGNVFFSSYTPSGNAIVLHRADRTDKIAAATSRKTADGDWLLTPFPGAATDSGETFFPAYVWSRGQVHFGLFQASPR